MADISTVATLLGAVGSSATIAAAINFYANRKKVGADATKIITDAATAVVSSLRERIEELERREDEREAREREWKRLLEEHHDWDVMAARAIDEVMPPIDLPDPPPLYPRDR